MMIDNINIYLANEMNRHNWTQQEDESLKKVIIEQGVNDWSQNASSLQRLCSSAASKRRSGKQCRERWFNHLDPSVKKTKWTESEQEKLFQIHKHYGNKWKQISLHMDGRTDNDIKNRFYSTLRRSLRRLNKYIGKKNSTSQLREIKPSVLTVIINFIYQNQQGDQKDTLVQDLKELPQLIFKFATFKPVKQNMGSSSDNQIIGKINMIMQLVEKYKENYIKEKGKVERNTYAQMDRDSEIGKQEKSADNPEEQEEEPQVKQEYEEGYFSPLVKRQEEEEDEQLLYSRYRQKNYVARQINPIITIQRKPSMGQNLQHHRISSSGLKQENVMQIKIHNLSQQFNNHSLMMGLQQDQIHHDMMPIQEPSMSAMSINASGDPLLGDLVIVGKHIEPIEYEATDENNIRSLGDIDQILYQNYDTPYQHEK